MVLTAGSTLQEEEAVAAAALKLHQAAALEGGVVGLATASAAMTLAVCEPPAGIHPDAYFLAVSGCFFTGVAQLAWALSGTGGRHGTGRKLLYASLGPLAAAVGLSVASSLLGQ
ncbi:hypothetical protein GQ55_5G475900 [Panicum hallii var. hallii]|uniref:Uncharacterized protein n=1 Tax=Panicum hallii var. hallii TaxID=1504633 RepID=A0A2T7DR11_9POAL|nr:hypothetical protein GQ55_5G475900 [Panicum hallii var. hallii]